MKYSHICILEHSVLYQDLYYLLLITVRHVQIYVQTSKVKIGKLELVDKLYSYLEASRSLVELVCDDGGGGCWIFSSSSMRSLARTIFDCR